MKQPGLLSICCLLVWFSASMPVHAGQEVKQFVRGSYQQILAARQGKPFIVNFWSLTCSYCLVELSMFNKLLKKYPNLDLVLISTDSPEEEKEISSTLAKSNLGKADAWVFADSYVERLRFDVDRKWQGELPRTYFFSGKNDVVAVSGKVEYQEVEQWVKQQSVAR